MKAAHNQLELVGQWLRKLSHQLIPNIGTLVLVALLLFAYHAWAAPSDAPQAEAPASGVNTGMLSYQGYLTDASGEPLTGDVDITFRLYDAPSGGAALWTEAHTGDNAVPVEDGLFNVMLGSLTPISSTVWSSGASYLGVQVGDDAEMSPREVVGNVPTALTVPDGAITVEKFTEDTIPVFSASTTEEYWTSPQCDGSYRLIPGLEVDFTIDNQRTLSIDFTGLGRNSDVDGNIYTAVFVNGSSMKTSAGRALVGGCRNSDIDSGEWCTLANSAAQVLEPGNYTVEIKAQCNSGEAQVYTGWMKVILFP
jgi:hypothetical protein